MSGSEPMAPTPPLAFTEPPVAPVAPGAPWAPGPPIASPLLAVRVIGLVLVLGMLGLAAGSVTAQFFEQHTVLTDTVAAPVTRLVTDTDTGDVRVHAGSPGQPVQITRTLKWSFWAPRSQWTDVGGTLTVTGGCSGGGWHWGGCSVDLDVTVPAGTAVQLTSTTGSIAIAGLAGDLTATSSTGDVTISGTGAHRVVARTDTGDVTVTSTGNDSTVQADTGTGDVSLSFAAPPASVTARTDTGDVTVALPPGSGYLVQTGTDTGTASTEVSKDAASTHRIDARTATGDVLVRYS
jgi:hypothetical protein